VQALVDAGEEGKLQDMLGKRLEFGTAGLRGRMGPGFNAMNTVTVQQTTQGLCRYLQHAAPEQLKAGGVVIGFDGRHNSASFAHTAAAVFLSQGVRVHLFSGMVPTPFVAAGVAELGAAAGIMVTASHNPKADNGYKVYWGNGCQIIPPHDEGIAAQITAHLPLWALPADISTHPQLSDPTRAVEAAYYARLHHLRYRSPADNSSAQPVTYTPLHGVGLQTLLRAFEVFGLPAPHVVAAQAAPDPEFPTVTFPNPEEGRGTWALAFREGGARGSRLVIANDPDADRLAVAEADPSAPGGYHAFTGNEIGALLADWLWTNYKRTHPGADPSRCVLLASAVSSRFLAGYAAREGLVFEETLTGFKWLGSRARALEAQGMTVLFAYEEAIGFMPGAMYRDKDGVSAGAAFAEMAAALYARGGTLKSALADLYNKYGFSAYRSSYFIADKPAKSAAVFDRLRAGGHYPTSLAGVPVAWVRDLGTGLDTREPDRRARLPWRAGDLMITLGLATGGSSGTLTLRASGTEPKLKYYLEVVDADAAAATTLADRLAAAVRDELVRVQEAGLTLPVQH